MYTMELVEKTSTLTKKKKAMIVVSVLVVLVLLGMKAHNLWQQKSLCEETIATLDWEIPLQKDFKFIDWRYLNKNEEFEKHNLRIFSVDVEEKDAIFEKLYGVMDKKGNVIIPAIYWNLSADWDRGYILAENWDVHKAQYYDLKGKNFISGTFKKAELFENGYAVVEDELGYHIIEPSGSVKLNFDCKYLYLFDSEKKLYKFKYQNENDIFAGEWGIVDLEGNILLEPNYNVIQKAGEDKILVIDSTNGRFNQKRKYLNYDFKPAFDEIFDDADQFSDGLAPVKRQDGTRGLINRNGELVQKINCNEMYCYSEGLAIVGRGNYLCGINRNGKIVFKIPYSQGNNLTGLTRGFQDGLLLFRAQNEKYGYIDANGTVVIAPVFDDADPFENGKTFVEVNGQGGVINRNGI